MRFERKLLLFATALIAVVTPSAAASRRHLGAPAPPCSLTGLEGASGSTVGPGGALYVTEGAAGRISRVDPKTGEITTFASGLPPAIPASASVGAIDVAFIGKTAYVLVTLVGSDVGGSDVVGIYRVDGPTRFHRRRGHRRVLVEPIRRTLRSSSRPESSTRWNPTVAGSWSPMGTTTGCCGSPSTARSPS